MTTFLSLFFLCIYNLQSIQLSTSFSEIHSSMSEDKNESKINSTTNQEDQNKNQRQNQKIEEANDSVVLKSQIQSEIPQKQQKEQQEREEQIPDKFYDSDLASVNQKDFLSDNEPPKDIVYERKRLHKEKNLHIYKTIVRVGLGIDKPAPYDEIKLRFREQMDTGKEGVEAARTLAFVEGVEFEVYNLGKKYGELERLVTSMKKGEVALFEVQWVEVSKKSNIKVLKQKQVYTIQVESWTTAIDLDSKGNVLKYLLKRGEGPYRVSKYNEVSYDLEIKYHGVDVVKESKNGLKMEDQAIGALWPIVWRVMGTMKKGETGKVGLTDQEMREMNMTDEEKRDWEEQTKVEQKPEGDEIKQTTIATEKVPKCQRYQQLLTLIPKDLKIPSQPLSPSQKPWQLTLSILDLHNIDDIYMDGSILKKVIIKGVSTAKPQSGSLIYYALKFLDEERNVLWEDKCFNSDWWEDFGKLDLLGCRKNYMDQYKMSKFLKATMKRMKPAQVSQAECRNLEYFQYGHDYEQLQTLLKQKGKPFPPKRVYLAIRVYNFTEAKNCFNMAIEQKILQSKRKKITAVKLLNDGNLKKAFKRFQNIVSFYNSGDLNQGAYEEKISALMNSILCLMKQGKYAQMIPLCNTVLEKPRHGFNQDKMQLKAQGIKVEGNTKNVDGEEIDSREAANLDQNTKILEKCLYRKGLALLKIGQSKQALECLNKITETNEEIQALKAEAQKKQQNYEQKTKKIFKSMFGA